MERIKVTEADVKRALIEARDEKGDDYVYVNPEGESAGNGEGPACFYVHGNGEGAVPGCLVGNALHRLGVPLEDLAEWEQNSAYVVARELIDVTDSEAAFHTLANVQDAQDNGESWGEALRRYNVVTGVDA